MSKTILTLFLLLAPQALGIVNGTPPQSTDLRYDAVGAFAVSWRLGFDQGSHADDSDHNWFCNATLVNSQAVLLAKHCLDPYGETATYMVRFRRQTDGSLGTVSAGVSSFYHERVSYFWEHPTRDLAVGFLENPVTHIAPLPASAEGAFVDEGFVHAGWGREGPGFGEGTYTRLLLCQNVVTAIHAINANIYYATTFTPLPNDCGPNSIDSGSPILVSDACGNLRVIGAVRVTYAAEPVDSAVIEQAPADYHDPIVCNPNEW